MFAGIVYLQLMNKSYSTVKLSTAVSENSMTNLVSGKDGAALALQQVWEHSSTLEVLVFRTTERFLRLPLQTSELLVRKLQWSSQFEVSAVLSNKHRSSFNPRLLQRKARSHWILLEVVGW